MTAIDPAALLFFVFGWLFALNIAGLADRVHQLASRHVRMIGTSVTFRIMGGIWVLVGGVHLLRPLLS
ncbi:hypothetical protein ACIRPP_23140 [Streptomyces sp. NPDC101219]|uniref:hypothetical protein n=1 Tax=Streptomyces sp. NPDC101219 TaxID=3366131 RepID=UPI003809DA02